jgi:hypothetical protein
MKRIKWTTKSDGELLLALDAAGGDVPPALVRELVSRGERLAPALLDRATDPTRWGAESFTRYVSAVHALNLLGALRVESVVDPLIGFALMHPDALDFMFQVPAVLGHLGEPALEPLLAALSAELRDDAGTILCLSLSSIAVRDPNLSRRICAAVRGLLPHLDDPMAVLCCSRLLAELHDSASLAVVRQVLAAHGVGKKSVVWMDLMKLFGTSEPLAAARWECTREPLEHFKRSNLRELQEVFEEDQEDEEDEEDEEDDIPTSPEALLDFVVQAMPEARALLASLPGGTETALRIVREMPCPRGSGKQAFRCHLRDTDDAPEDQPLADEVVVTEAEVCGLPLTAEVWELASFDTGTHGLDDDGVPQPAHLTLVADVGSGMLLGMDTTFSAPAADTFRALVTRTCAHPQVGEPRRPAVVRVDEPSLMAELVLLASRVGFELEFTDELPAIREAQEGMRKFAEAEGRIEPRPGLLEVPGVTEPAVASAFRAAASFYRKAPWMDLEGELPVEIRTELADGGSCVAIVMGRAGECEGLALYDSWEKLEAFIDAVNEGHAAAIATTACLTVHYVPLERLPPDDHRNALLHQWSAASQWAYPFFFRMDPGRQMRRPLSRELELLEAALRALPRFLDKHVVNGWVPDSVEEKMKVKTASGTQTVQLACWPEGRE